jgi:predicted dehydrogenase
MAFYSRIMASTKLRLIQAGVGGFGKSWLAEVSAKSADFDVVAIVDLSAENLAAAARDIDCSARPFGTLEQALEEVEADALLTVTPPPVHAVHARLAFAHGLHLMTEKPLAGTIEAAREMLRLARESGKILMVSQNYRFSPAMQRARELLAQEVLGAFGHGHLDFYIPADFTGTFRETMEFPLLVDMAIHHLDLIRSVTGRNIVRVTAQSFRPAWSWYQHEPGLKMLLELEDGLSFSYSGDWSARGRGTTWNGNWRLQCAEGSMHIDQDQISLERCERWGKDPRVEQVEIPPLARSQREATLHLFAEAIRSGTPGELGGESNLWSFGAVMAGVRSAQSGGLPVSVAEVIGA